MAKKIDLSGVKEFMFNHGEKVALGTCAFIAILFGSLGLLRALSANKADGTSKSLVEVLTEEYQRISGGISRAQAPELPDQTKKRMTDTYGDWKYLASNHPQNPLIQMGPEEAEKRANPTIYAIRKESKYFDMQTITTCVLVHKHDSTGVKVLGDPPAGGGGGVPGGGGALGGGGAGGGVKPPGGAGGDPKIGSGGSKGGIPFMHAGKPLRAVVATAVFPMKAQVLEFQRALKMQSQSEMLDPGKRDDAPWPLGIDVIRFELKPNGEFVNPNGEMLVGFDPKTGKFVKSPALDALLREAVFDEALPVALEPYLFEGLHLPLPRLAHGRYPQFSIDGFEIAWGEDEPDAKGGDVAGGKQQPKGPGDSKGGAFPGLGKGGPKGGKGAPMDDENGPAAPDREVKVIKVKDLQKDHLALHNRLYSKNYNIYHVLGLPRPDKDAADKGRYFSAWDIDPPKAGDGEKPGKGPGPGPGKPPGAGPGGGPGGGLGTPDIGLGGKGGEKKQPGNPGLGGNQGSVAKWDRDAIVRFIDPDVEPGRTYKYQVRVRMKNPNFDKQKEVAFAKLAEVDVLMSDWESTPSIYVPEEYRLFAVDQQLLDEWSAPPVLGKKPAAPPFDPKWREHVPLQIHQWVQKKFDPEERKDFVIGDWAVAERVLVRRGEKIGERVTVVVPVWHELRDAFVIPSAILEKNPKDKKTKKKPGIEIDMRREVTDPQGRRVAEEAPVLVDYVGGKRGRQNIPEEESALEALILTADGSLKVLNSRLDSDPAFDAAKERQERVISVRRRAASVSGAADAPPDKGGNFPGMKK